MRLGSRGNPRGGVCQRRAASWKGSAWVMRQEESISCQLVGVAWYRTVQSTVQYWPYGPRASGGRAIYLFCGRDHDSQTRGVQVMAMADAQYSTVQYCNYGISVA